MHASDSCPFSVVFQCLQICLDAVLASLRGPVLIGLVQGGLHSKMLAARTVGLHCGIGAACMLRNNKRLQSKFILSADAKVSPEYDA